MTVDFGKTATDYARYRAGFPERFFDRVFNHGWIAAGNRVLDLGTGTGTLARGLAKRGCNVVGLDPSSAMVEQAKVLDADENVEIEYVIASAEKTGLQSHSFDVVTAGQCWHWFNRPKAALETQRLLKLGGRLIIAHFDWLPLPGSVVEAMENLTAEHNPQWDKSHARPLGLAGTIVTGIHPYRFEDLAQAGFSEIESFSFDNLVPYSREAWLGRIRASAGIGASLPPEAIARFDAAHRKLLASQFPDEPLQVPHRVFAVSGRSTGSGGMTGASKIRIRRYRSSDLDSLIEVFRGSVRRIASRDYTRDQVMAWAPDDIDREARAIRHSSKPTWVAEIDGAFVGFVDLEPDGHLDCMYVHADYQRRGVASALLRQVEEAAKDQGIERLYSEVSITARPFFERFGFRVIAAQTVTARGQEFLNFRMEKHVISK